MKLGITVVAACSCMVQGRCCYSCFASVVAVAVAVVDVFDSVDCFWLTCCCSLTAIAITTVTVTAQTVVADSFKCVLALDSCTTQHCSMTGVLSTCDFSVCA